MTILEFNGDIPSIDDLKCSPSWWQVESETLFFNELQYGVSHYINSFANKESESWTNNEYIIQIDSFTLVGLALQKFYDSVIDVT